MLTFNVNIRTNSEPTDTLITCILDIKSWMAGNFLQVNQDKTGDLVIGPEGEREKLAKS